MTLDVGRWTLDLIEMAVYEHTYGRYTGALTPEWSRFLIIPRHALRQVFGSKLLVAFYAACFIYPLVAAILIYLHHNASAIAMLKLNVRELLPIDGSFFETFISVQGWLGFLLTVLVGPPLVSRDLANNALPLYLCRPFTRAEYVLGKMSVVMLLLSSITWVPGLLLFLFQGYLEGAGWIARNWWIASGICLGSWVWMITLALLSQAVSAWVKWRVIASAALLGIFFIPTVFGGMINALFLTRWGNLLSIPIMMSHVWDGLFRVFERKTGEVSFHNDFEHVEIILLEPPLWMSWALLATVCAVCLLLLMRKVRAYEVVK
ncbi:MAG: ABC transporter permease [Pyrinomonadaceae bacterium]|nr:ABC transporter permease [Pyrinomonadaceae bacterium]